jgi:hypothetical protein
MLPGLGGSYSPPRICVTMTPPETGKLWERHKDMEVILGNSTECPNAYTMVDKDADENRRQELFRKRCDNRQGLSPQEDAEEAHLCGRIAAFEGARGRDSKRIDALKTLGEKRSAAELK